MKKSKKPQKKPRGFSDLKAALDKHADEQRAKGKSVQPVSFSYINLP